MDQLKKPQVEQEKASVGKSKTAQQEKTVKEKEDNSKSFKTTKGERDEFRDAIVSVAGKNNHNALTVKLPDSLVVTNAKGNLEQLAEMQVLRGRVTFTNGNGEKLQTLALSSDALSRILKDDIKDLIKSAVQKKEVHEKVVENNKVVRSSKEQQTALVSEIKALMGDTKYIPLSGFGTQYGTVADKDNKAVSIIGVRQWDDNVSFTATVPGEDLKNRIFLHPKDIRPEFYPHLVDSVKDAFKPLLVTVNNEKVSAVSVYQSLDDPNKYLIKGKLDDKGLRPRILRNEDLKAFNEGSLSLKDLFVKYYPTKVAKKFDKEQFWNMGLSNGEALTKVRVYRPENELDKDNKKNKTYYLYAEKGDKRFHRVALSHDMLDAYFDKTMTVGQIAEKVLGEQLHLKSAYEKYVLPENVKKVSLRKNNDGAYVVSAVMDDGRKTSEKKVSGNDLYSYFRAKSVTQQQLAAKYLADDFKTVAKRPMKVEHHQGLGLR